MHPKKTKIFSFHQGLTFLGYRFIVKNNRLVVLMSPKTKKRITKNIKRVYKKKPQNKDNVLASYKGYLLNCECNSYLKKNHFHLVHRSLFSLVQNLLFLLTNYNFAII